MTDEIANATVQKYFLDGIEIQMMTTR